MFVLMNVRRRRVRRDVGLVALRLETPEAGTVSAMAEGMDLVPVVPEVRVDEELRVVRLHPRDVVELDRRVLLVIPVELGQGVEVERVDRIPVAVDPDLVLVPLSANFKRTRYPMARRGDGKARVSRDELGGARRDDGDASAATPVRAGAPTPAAPSTTTATRRATTAPLTPASAAPLGR
jgi:hypothetical protein